MASISTDKNGNRTMIQFIGPDGKRKTVRLGSASEKTVQEVARRIEALVTARKTGTALDPVTAKWLSHVSLDMARKLAKAGLVGPAPEPEPPAEAVQLGPFLSAYVGRRGDVKPYTRRNLDYARTLLVDHFGAGRALRSITPADAEAFRFHLRATYAEATTSRAVRYARQFFDFARRGGLVDADPFALVKTGSMVNEARLTFVDRPTITKLMEAAPDAEWRLIVALARFLGLRTPSEQVALTWGDIDWDRGRVLVRSPKTGERLVPLFPEVRPYLADAFDRAKPGAVHVITRNRDPESNWRTVFLSIIRRAGLVPWERCFQNLRASRETELVAEYPLHIAAAWLGNSNLIAARHYLKVRDEDFDRAAFALQRGVAGGCPELGPTGEGSRNAAGNNDRQPLAT